MGNTGNQTGHSNVDIAMQELRKLQDVIYDRDSSPNRVFDHTLAVQKHLTGAQEEMRRSYAQLNAVLSLLASKGGLTPDVLKSLSESGADESVISALKFASGLA